MPPLYLIQWGIVGFFVAIHFLIGFLRGSSKSTYFTIVSLILTVVTLWLVSRISLNFIFNNFITIDSLVTLVQGYTGNAIPQEFIVYILNPTLLAFVIAIIDLVIRIIAFISIYPFLKWSLTMTIFRPIWKHGIKKALLKKQNEKEQIKFEEDPKNKKKFVKSKKLNKPILGRLFGASMGALRGFVVGFVFLIPILVISGFVSGISAINLSQDGTTRLGSDPQEIIAIPNEVMDILANIEEMNEKGLGALTRQIVINGKSIDRLIFDMVFTTQVVDSGELVGEISLGQEFESIIGIAQILIQGGYLEDDFNFETISTDNLEDVEQIMGLLGKSTLLQSMIPVATSFGVSSFLPDYINGVNLYDRPSTADALDNFTSIDWENEFNNFYGIIEAVLEFGSVSELMAYADDPLLLLELSPEEAQKFTDIIRAFGKLETLYLLNVAADFATSYTSVQDLITWVDPSEREAYLQDKLAFILDNPNFFITTTNEDDEEVEGEIGRIADFIEAIYSDAYGEVDVRALFESIDTPAEFVELQNPDWVGHLIDQLVEIELLIELIPFGVDYGIYNIIGEDLDREIADNIASALSETEWDAEFINVGEIYRNVLMLGIGSVLGDQPDYYAFIDSVVVDHMDSVRAIIENIFENSQVVNTAIEYATPYLLESFIADEALRNLVSDALISDSESGVVDFSFGEEINRILTIVETIYEFSTTSEIASLSGMTVDAQLTVVASFGALPQDDYDTFIEALSSMQLFERIGKSGLEYIASTRDIPQLYIPEEVDLGADLASVFNLIYYAANYLHQESMLIPLIEDVDFAPLLADEIFRSYLLPTDLNNHSSFITSNIAHNIKLYGTDVNLSNYITIPTELVDLSPESIEWQSEVGNLLGAVFDLGSFFEDSETISLSARELVILSADPLQAPVTLITQFADEDMTKAREAFGNLDGSLVFRSSISTIIESLGTQSLSFIEGYELTFPAIAMENGIIKEEMFVELIYGVATLLDGMNQTLGFEKIAEFQTNEDNYLYVNAFNQITDEALVDFSSITVLRGIISDLILSDSLQGYVRNTLNNSGTLQVSDQFFTFERENNLLSVEDVSGLFISLKSLQATPEFYYNPGDVLPFISTLDNTKLTGFFDSTIIKEIFTQVFTDEGLLSFGVDTVNQMQAIIVLPVDFFSIDEAVMIEDGLIKTEELVNLFIAVQALGLDSAEALASLNETTFANLVDPASKDLEGKDDLDRVLASHYIYIILDRAFALEGISTFAGTTLGIGSVEDPVNLNPPTTIKVNDPLNVIEHNRLPKAEFRRLFTTISMLGDTSQLSDPTAVISLMTDMIGRDVDIDTGEDDFDLFMSSDYFYYIISVLLQNQEQISVPIQAIETLGMYDGFIKRTEIRSVLNALTILEIVDFNEFIAADITVDNLENIINEDESYMVQYLLSQAIIEALDPNVEGLIPYYAYEDEDNSSSLLKYDELRAISETLSELAESAFEVDNVEGYENSGQIPLMSLIDLLSDPTVSQVEIISNTGSIILKEELTTQILVNLDYSAEDIYEGIFDLTYVGINIFTNIELTSIAQTLRALAEDVAAVDENAGDIKLTALVDLLSDPTVGQVDIIGETNSLLLKTELTKQMLDNLGYDPLTLDAEMFLNDDPATGILKDTEIDSIVITLSLLANDVYDPDDIDNTYESANDIELTVLVDLLVDPSVLQVEIIANTNSQILKIELTKQLLFHLEYEVSQLPSEAFEDSDKTKPFTKNELVSIAASLMAMANDSNDPVSSIDPTKITVEQVVSLKTTQDPTSTYDALDSYVIQLLISEQAIPVLGVENIPNNSYANNPDNTRLNKSSIIEIINAIDIVSGPDKSIFLSAVNFDLITIGQVQELHITNGLLTNLLISNTIVDTVGVASVPIDAYDDTDSNLLDYDEVTDMIAALRILGDDNDPSTDTDEVILLELFDGTPKITIAKAKLIDENDSVIIKQINSDNIVTMLTIQDIIIPIGAYLPDIDLNRLSNAEISAMISSLEIIAGNDTDNVDEITFDESSFTITKLKSLPDSLIMNRIISSGLMTNMPNIPIESFLETDPLEVEYKLDILRIEIDNIFDALLTNLGIDDPSSADNIGTEQITFSNLENILLLGTVGSANEHPEGYSPIINHILSTPMIAAVSRTIGGHNYGIPSTSLVNDNDLFNAEVNSLVQALKYIGNVGTDLGQSDPVTTTLFDVSNTLNPSVFGPSLLTQLIGLNSLVVYRMISLGIQDANIANSDAYAVNPDYNYDPELPLTPAYEDIKIAEMEHLVVSMNILGIVELSDILTQITIVNLQALTPAEIEILVEDGTNGPNTIIYYIISTTVDSGNNLFDTLVILDPVTYPEPADNYYVLDGLGDRVRLKRSSIADALAAL